MDLRDYETAKFELSEILQSAAVICLDQDRQEHQDRIRELLVRLAEDRFNLVVAGRFNRGKSSLMNAILGLDRLPTGIVPLTSVITTVSYGSKEKVRLTYQRQRLDSEIELSKLPQYITQQGNPGNKLEIATANIELPVEILRRGFFFVDTPGLGSVISENTQTTQAYLPEADALLLVTSFESPLSEDELGFFSAASRLGLPTFVAINKHDLVKKADRDQALSFVQSHLLKFPGHSSLDIFSVSASDGLSAKLSGDTALLQASGVPQLEDRLIEFLLERKRTVFLMRMSDRVEELLLQLPEAEKSVALSRRLKAISVAYKDSQGPNKARLRDDRPDAIFNRNQLRSCQICSEVESVTWDFLARFQYELSVNRETQTDFAFRSGFCCYHTWEYQAVASSYGTCSGYPALLERIAASLTAAADSSESDPKLRIGALVPARDGCVVCTERKSAETAALAELVAILQKDADLALKGLSALCLPHLLALVEAIDDAETGRRLAGHHAKTFERVAEDMRRFSLKQSALRRHLETSEEKAAAQRALLLLAGLRNANFGVDSNPARRAETHDSGRPTSRFENDND